MDEVNMQRLSFHVTLDLPTEPTEAQVQEFIKRAIFNAVLREPNDSIFRGVKLNSIQVPAPILIKDTHLSLDIAAGR